MKALFKTEKGFGNVEVIDIPEPICKEDEMKIKVRSIGVCGTDLHIYEGTFPYFNTPVILGHEFTGEIVEIGSRTENIKNFSIGDKVVVLPSAAVICGNCEYCKSGNFIFCKDRKGMGHGVNGGMTEYVCVNEKLLYKLPNNINFEIGTLIEPLSCCLQAVDDFINITPNLYCMVSGPGPMGLLIVKLLSLRNSSTTLFGKSIDTKRLEFGKRNGADFSVNVDDENQVEEVFNCLGVNYFDIGFECSGSCYSLASCLNFLKKRGTVIQVGLFNKDCNVNFNNVVLKNLSIFGSLGFTWKTWDKSIELLKTKKMILDGFITHSFSLEKWDAAFKKAAEPDAIKVTINFD